MKVKPKKTHQSRSSDNFFKKTQNTQNVRLTAQNQFFILETQYSLMQPLRIS